jgi:hypothetical protein
VYWMGAGRWGRGDVVLVKSKYKPWAKLPDLIIFQVQRKDEGHGITSHSQLQNSLLHSALLAFV